MGIVHKKGASIVTAAVLLVTMSTTGAVADTLSDKLKSQQNTLQQHKNQYKSVQNKIANLEAKIEEFDGRIESLMSEIEENRNKIKSIESDIDLAQSEIEKAQKDIEEEQELFNERIKAMYMNGIGGYLEVFLGAEDLSDFIERIEAVKQITELDKKIVNDLKRKQEDLQAKQEKLQKEKSNLKKLNIAQQEKVKKLEEDKKKQDKLIAEAKAQSALYSDALKADEEQIAQTKKLIEQAKQRYQSSASSSRTGSKSSSSSSRPSRGSGASYSSDALISYAAQFQGTPYVWGATGPDSFDCSGFTKYVYAHFGINLPRVSCDQAEVGTYVSKDDLQPGDLVFFKSGSNPVHHVGIYVGNGSYIHAPRTGDVVKISSLSSRSDYAWARRVR
jgi:peptidoglycan DL-endopeptidase CwlO